MIISNPPRPRKLKVAAPAHGAGRSLKCSKFFWERGMAPSPEPLPGKGFLRDVSPEGGPRGLGPPAPGASCRRRRNGRKTLPTPQKKTPGQGGNIERNGKWKTKPQEAETKGARLCSDKKITPPTPSAGKVKCTPTARSGSPRAVCEAPAAADGTRASGRFPAFPPPASDSGCQKRSCG